MRAVQFVLSPPAPARTFDLAETESRENLLHMIAEKRPPLHRPDSYIFCPHAGGRVFLAPATCSRGGLEAVWAQRGFEEFASIVHVITK